MEQKTEFSNIPKSIESKLNRQLHNQKGHPLEIIKHHIYKYFDSLPDYKFEHFDNLPPFVDVKQNFDNLLIPANHVSRSRSDTYYINENQVLRTHTSAHQVELLSNGHNCFLVTGDVYRKDEIDSNHYPVFHQMEGVVKVNQNPKEELLKILNGLIEYLFPGCEYRTNNDYFPFTDPSYEYEVKYNDKWLEVLGCGVMHSKIIETSNLVGSYVAFGLGLERLAMVLFNIPDIRYFWTDNPKFLEQFKDGKITEFQPYSELPSQTRDISFWVPDDEWKQENDFFDVARESMKDNVEQIKLFDKFFHPKLKKYSRTYRITYSSDDPKLKDPADFTVLCNTIQDAFRLLVQSKLNLELR